MLTATFTANLLAETTFYVDDYRPGKTSRATEQTFQVGGKGLNVAKMLRRLDAAHLALCFPGGAHGPICVDWLESSGLNYRAYAEGCETRLGSVARAPGQAELTILGRDSIVSEAALQSCVDELARLLQPFVFAICGSIPRWESPLYDPLRDWITHRPSDAILAVDTYGPPLAWLARQRPALIKINRTELETLFAPDRRSESTPTLLEEARTTFGPGRWIVTDGAGPVWIRDGDSPSLSLQPRTVENAYPTGCGDVFFATAIDCLYHRSEYDLESAARLASEYASRNAAQRGIADFALDQAPRTRISTIRS